MMRVSALLLVTFLVGCSSSSSSGVEDAGDDGSKTKPRDASHDAVKDSAAHVEAGLVCAPHTGKDAGADAPLEAAVDAALDAHGHAKDAAAKPDADAGPVHCTADTECEAGEICDTKTSGAAAGTCVANDGATFCKGVAPDGGTGGGAAGGCTENAGDMCCTTTAGCFAKPVTTGTGDTACCPGAAGDTYCQSELSNDMATCTGNVCTTCQQTCITANPAAYEKFLGYQLTDCGCTANGACYEACHDATSSDATSACGVCLTAQTAEDLDSTCTLTAAGDCQNDPQCTAYQACAGACPM